MRIYTSNIVAIAAFIACVDKSSVEAKAVADFHSARTGPATDFALVERRLRSDQLKEGEERMEGGGLEKLEGVVVKGTESNLRRRTGFLLQHLGALNSEISTVEAVVAANEAKLATIQHWDKAKELAVLRSKDVASLTKDDQHMGAIVAAQYMRSKVPDQAATGLAYLDRLARHWEGNIVDDVAKFVLPDTTILDLNGVAVLKHFIEYFEKEEEVAEEMLIKALLLQYRGDGPLYRVVALANKYVNHEGLEIELLHALARHWFRQGRTREDVSTILRENGEPTDASIKVIAYTTFDELVSDVEKAELNEAIAAYKTKLATIQGWDEAKKLDILGSNWASLSLDEQHMGAIVAAQFTRLGDPDQAATGLAYLDRLAKHWEGKRVDDVAKFVLPDTTILDLDGAAVLKHFIEYSAKGEEAAEQALIEALKTRYEKVWMLYRIVDLLNKK